MDGSEGNGYHQFFLQPTTPWHRRYEALRAVFVDEESLKDVATQFQLSYGTLRNWVSEFRTAYDGGQPPPFFRRRRTRGPRPTTKLPMTLLTRLTSRRSPMSNSCRWK